MAHLELVALIVRDYDRAIDFFVDVLQSSSSKTAPHSPTTDGPSAGSSSARVG